MLWLGLIIGAITGGLGTLFLALIWPEKKYEEGTLRNRFCNSCRRLQAHEYLENGFFSCIKCGSTQNGCSS